MEHHGSGACFLDCTWRPRNDAAGGRRVDTEGSARDSHDSEGDLGSGNESRGRGDSAISRPATAAASSRSSGKPYLPAASSATPRPSLFPAPLGELSAVAGSSSAAASPVLEIFRADEPWHPRPQSSFDLSRTRRRPR